MGNTLQTPSPPPQEPTNNDEDHNPKEQEIAAEEEGKAKEESFTCEICFEPTKKSTRTIIRCTHQYCVDCTVKYIKVKIEDDNEPHVKCPAANCTHTLDPVACAPLVGPATFVRWCDALCRSALSGSDACYCPYADCSELLLSDCKNRKSKNANKTKRRQCPKCKRWLCFACKEVWHAGFGCDDAPTDRADVEFGRLAERMTWMRCPGCRHFVELREGCRLVRCRCGISFCYKCGKKIISHEQRCDCHDSSIYICCHMTFLIALVILATALVFFLLAKLVSNTHISFPLRRLEN